MCVRDDSVRKGRQQIPLKPFAFVRLSVHNRTPPLGDFEEEAQAPAARTVVNHVYKPRLGWIDLYTQLLPRFTEERSYQRFPTFKMTGGQMKTAVFETSVLAPSK